MKPTQPIDCERCDRRTAIPPLTICPDCIAKYGRPCKGGCGRIVVRPQLYCERCEAEAGERRAAERVRQDGERAVQRRAIRRGSDRPSPVTPPATAQLQGTLLGSEGGYTYWQLDGFVYQQDARGKRTRIESERSWPTSTTARRLQSPPRSADDLAAPIRRRFN